jgi:hypothetical protein
MTKKGLVKAGQSPLVKGLSQDVFHPPNDIPRILSVRQESFDVCQVQAAYRSRCQAGED